MTTDLAVSDMDISLSPTCQVHCSAIVSFVIYMTLTLTFRGGHVTGWPLLGGVPKDGTSLTRQADDISTRLEHTIAQLRYQETQITDLSADLAKVTQSVSFTVTFGGHNISELLEGQTLKFDKVLFNAGDGYNPKTGLFTAPSDGLYTFSVQVSRYPSDPNKCLDMYLVHSSKPHILSALSKSQQPPSLEQQRLSPSDFSKQRQSPSDFTEDQPVTSKLFKQTPVMNVELCNSDKHSAHSQAVVHLARGDMVHVQLRSGAMLKGDGFTSMSGLKLPDGSPFFIQLPRQ